MAHDGSKRKLSDQLSPIRTNIAKEDDKQSEQQGEQGKQQEKQSGKQDELESLFGAPPLIPGDDPAVYNNLLAEVGATFKPRDIIGKFLNWKMTNDLWSYQRLQGVETTILKTTVQSNLHLEEGDRDRAVAVSMTENLELFERLNRLKAGREHEFRETYRINERHSANSNTIEDVEFSEVNDSSSDSQTAGDKGEDHE